MTDYKELIKALHCSASVNEKCKEDCPYRSMEEIKPEFPLPADVAVDGVDYYVSCDCDRMVNDAANAIERLVKERDVLELQNHLERCEHEHTRKERDAAVALQRGNCVHCKHFNSDYDTCLNCDCRDMWEWRGVTDDN